MPTPVSQALETQGTIISRGDGAPTELFEPIGEIISFNGPGGSASVIDVSSLQSVRREKRMGLPDEGQFTFEANLLPSDTAQEGCRADRANRALRNFQVTLTDEPPTVLTFSAYVLQFAVSGGVDAVVKLNATLEITGEVVWTPGA
jgi:hypothetical protein